MGLHLWSIGQLELVFPAAAIDFIEGIAKFDHNLVFHRDVGPTALADYFLE